MVLKHLLGYPKVRVYEGTWTEYSTTDLPIATGAEKTTSKSGYRQALYGT
ncbi:hypothetical protein ACKFKF_06755 [Phormidesmis sp. 146-12]